MPYCTKCGKKVKEGDQFCPYCGATVMGELRTTEVESSINVDIDCCGEPSQETSV